MSRRSEDELVIPEAPGHLRSLLVRLRLKADVAAIGRVLGVVLAEKPSRRTAAVLPEAFMAIAEGRLDTALVKRAWPILLERALGPLGHDTWRSGTMYALDRALAKRPAERGKVAALAARAMRSPSFLYRPSTASVVALATACAAAAGDDDVARAALAMWPRAIEKSGRDVPRNDELLLWSLETMARAGAVREVTSALGRLDGVMRKLAAKSEVLRSTKPPAPPTGAALLRECIEALRQMKSKHARGRRLAAAAITRARMGALPLPASLAAVLSAVGEVPDFTGSFLARPPRAIATQLGRMGVPRPRVAALAAALSGESHLLGDSALLYAGVGARADGELPVLTFVEDERMVLEAASYDVWLALRTGVLHVAYVGGLAVDPDHRKSMREAAKRFGHRMVLSTGQYVLRT